MCRVDGNSHERLSSALLASPAFRDLPYAVTGRIAECATVLDVPAGQVFIHQGDPGDSLMVLLSGVAEVFLETAGGLECIGTFRPGDVLGEMAFVTEEPRTASVRASTACQLVVLRADEFHRIASTSPELGMVLTHVVADRLGSGGRDGLGAKVIEGYRIESPVGRGATSVVYRAVEVETGRTVALKMMSHRLKYDPGASARFEREAATLLTLEHENIARVHSLLRAFKTIFLVMDFCEGETLERRLMAGGPFSEREASPVIAAVARALGYLHGKQIIHRDLKTSNVMWSPGAVKLIDFGLARQIEALDTALTATGAVVGTPCYMSPEQLRGGDTSPTDDYYALGCLAFELVMGRPLFRADNFYELVQLKSGEKPPLDELDRKRVSRRFTKSLEGLLGSDLAGRRKAFERIARRSN